MAEGTAEGGSETEGAWEDDGVPDGSLEVDGVSEGAVEMDGGCEGNDEGIADCVLIALTDSTDASAVNASAT
jgi:hypothetical protein